MTDIQKLKALAKAATPGPWAVASDWSRYAVYQKASPHKRVVCTGNQNNSELWVNAPWSGCDSRDADFIAAANPAAVLELIAELEDHALQTRSAREVCAESQGTILTLIAERDHLKAENERLQRFETAYKEFSDKTDWVRPNAASHELDMHVADILRKRCDDLASHNQAQAEEIKALRAASTPQHAGHIPGGAIADDVTGQRVIVSGDAINRLKASHPRACVNAGLCEKVGQRLYTRVFTELSACGTRGRS